MNAKSLFKPLWDEQKFVFTAKVLSYIFNAHCNIYCCYFSEIFFKKYY